MTMESAVKEKLSNAEALRELEEIRVQGGGILKAEQVVSAAADLHSPLHNYFEWDDTEAAAQWRLQQARTLIRNVVVIIPNHPKPVTAYVSMRDDRTQEGGGYRTLLDVMSNKDMREKFVAEALDDLNHWQTRYSHLKELEPVFEAIKAASRRVRK